MKVISPPDGLMEKVEKRRTWARIPLDVSWRMKMACGERHVMSEGAQGGKR